MGNRQCSLCNNTCKPITDLFYYNNNGCWIADNNERYLYTTNNCLICLNCIDNNNYKKCCKCDLYKKCDKYQVSNINNNKSNYSYYNCSECAIKKYILYNIN